MQEIAFSIFSRAQSFLYRLQKLQKINKTMPSLSKVFEPCLIFMGKLFYEEKAKNVVK